MTPELEQLADEAIELRRTNVESALGRHHVGLINRTGTGLDTADHLNRARADLTEAWERRRPALTRLADQRLAALAAQAEAGAR